MEWSIWSDKSEKEYTNLAEGHYTFTVRAKNVYDQISLPASFQFSIAPPWQRTWWAYSSYILLLVFLLFGGIRLNSRRLLAAQVRLEGIVAERTAEVVQQKDQIEAKNNELESAYNDLYSTNRQLAEAKNALWGEMELAKKIQTVLLPEKPAIPGYEIAAYMKPADEVGGDYYDVINVDVGARHALPLHHDRCQHWVVIGDVSGHGVSAGLVMMMVQTAINEALDLKPDLSPEKVLISVNRIIFKNIQKLGESKYMTITLMSIQENGAIYFSGLHQDIMIYRTKQQTVELVETQGMWIGIMDNIDGMIGVDQLTIESGDLMLLYTDGIVEATDSDGRMFSEERLVQELQSVAGQPPESIKNSILNSLKDYRCQDDVTLLILKRNPQP
jgi:serine phosphatase RsbU (regulator of sigma subunit)